MQMMRIAIISASSIGKNKIDIEDVTAAIEEEQFDFERIIPDEHYPILVKVYLSKEISKNEIGQMVIFNTSALEYNGNERWNYINPVVKSIECYQNALKVYTPDTFPREWEKTQKLLQAISPDSSPSHP
jgi:hypothetical protein